jgi:2-hydroxy-6-oxonona-2,4-dienedioate hydrolase
MRAGTLAELLTRLDMAPAVIAGGSGGARDSLVTAMAHPEVVSKVAVWWIVGGVFSTMNLGAYYILPNINTVRRMGMEGVLNMPQWQEEDEELGTIQVPTLIIRGGVGDLDHPKRTSMEVHCLIRGSQLVEPPWPEDAWERSTAAQAQGTGNRFDPWIQAAPLLLDFATR